ncbi:multicopper oxidase domain-containing protein (plasmid) [Mesorhizobium huakuii]|uniref:Multicopper oxidase domain-containing protein n=1 Tax=Mesorhizobium huakuii TaxID=28104 RepID=A0A7G6T5A0_9HYPH|nr:multicopper oxidase domain-containing protein [Mesorhizobium huakuii]QND69317.1 multicopper oxidase domain-containing protein [Mesorhizobium loti]
MLSRRQMLGASALLVGSAAWTKTSAQGLPDAPIMESPDMQPPLFPKGGPDYQPVVTLNGWTLPHRINNGVKEFHLVAEPVEREMAPGMTGYLWGYNGQSPGPTIEALEGDRVRIFVTNKLPEHTTIHWHGMILPSGMDGVGGLTQPQIPPGKTSVYEFDLVKSGTFMYHPHSDEMVQMAMGMMGFFVIHPKDRRKIRLRWQSDARRLVHRDEPGAYYEAQRLAARARASGQAGEFVHWAKVAAEIARISPRSHMDIAVVQAIVDDETRRGEASRSHND